jgi:3-oxoacyl-[acyl-carrier-protein] synthase II
MPSNGAGTRRVVVTGMGAVSALGNDVASTWDGLLAGRSGVRTIEAFDPSRVDSKIAAEVRDFDPSAVLDRTGIAVPAHFTRAYSARELKVRRGEPLRVEERCAGWLRVRNESGQVGWVPGSSVTQDPPSR